MKLSKKDEQNRVYLLHYLTEDDEYGDNARLIGIYSNRASAKQAIARLKNLDEFSDYIKGFQIEFYELNKDHWVEGFIDA